MLLIQIKFSFGLFMVKCLRKYLIIVSTNGITHYIIYGVFLEAVVKLEKPTIPDCYASINELYSCQRVLAKWNVNDGRVDYDNFHLHLWKAMNLFPIMAEAKSRLIVPHAFHFI